MKRYRKGFFYTTIQFIPGFEVNAYSLKYYF